MKDKKTDQLGTKEARDMDLDETPKPTRKVSHPSTPVAESQEPSTNDRIKGRQKIK